MNYLFFVQRVLAGIIDGIIVYIPLYLLVNTMVEGFFTPEIVTAVLYVIYNSLAIHSFDGQTIGKYFARIRVKDTGFSIMEDSVREVMKILYFIPIFGWLVGLISVVFFFKKGKFLHDLVGKSEVVLYG
ncbi:hypothetical protein IGI37_003768 [Enterococcus sp. AZ194]|uniref:RDD family protein n=1 Tax=Enterococcus sp. AZ194 TaxID=2774629 RepID=UPI003F23DDE9